MQNNGSQVEKAPERGLLHRWFGKDPSAKPVGLFTGDIFDVEIGTAYIL